MTGHIAGTVINDWREPVVGADVTLAGSTSTVHTDTTGFYVLANVPAGTQNVAVSKPDYFGQEKSTVVNEGETTAVNFVLVFRSA